MTGHEADYSTSSSAEDNVLTAGPALPPSDFMEFTVIN